MHSVRLTCFALGFWLAGGLFVAFVATQNFRGVDRLLEDPNPVARLKFKTLDDPRQLLRYHASEQNRFYFETWEIVQLVLGSILFFFVLFATREDKITLGIVLLMLLIAAAQRFFLTPQIVTLGRAQDFGPPVSGFPALHAGYVSIEMLKWLLNFGLAARLVIGHRRRRSSSEVRNQLDMIDKPNHRHINR
jgi:hypothetical protein